MDPQYIVTYLALILARMSGAIALNPIYGRSDFPPLARGGLTLALSFMVYIWTGGQMTVNPPTEVLAFSIAIVRELFIGFVLGFGIELAMLVVRFGTAVMDYTMGLSMAQVYDPSSNAQMSVSSGIYLMFMLLIFMVNDGHVEFLKIVFQTVEDIPFGHVVISSDLPQFVLNYFTACFALGLQFAMPVIVVEFLTEVGIGILMRIVPQINIFAVSFQMKIAVGLVMLMVLFNPMSGFLTNIWKDMFTHLYQSIGYFS
ncbi:MAG: flagellar biosynthetic protein FliR [Lachnospiraceae bacterium]|nr:flagellar biosynthetic protein FliR [Lachnospiraceae bacterium]MDD6578957.1 flagellar biosynthetic protein FliR [Lachnospiraceae bacterium]